MDMVSQKISEYRMLKDDERGECHGKAEIIEQLEESFNDPRVVDFFLSILSDGNDYDLARIAICKFLELDPPTTPRIRNRISQVLATALKSERDILVRQWLGLALSGYSDLPNAFEAARSCASDAHQDLDVRYNCLAALRILGPMEHVTKVFKELATGSDSIADTSRRQLAAWDET